MKWFRRKPPKLLPIPNYAPIEVKPQPKEEPGIEVKEGPLSDVGIDAESLTRTGVHRAWDRLTGRLRGE